MPKEFIDYGKTWLKHHPNWEMQLWNEDNMIPLQNQKIFDVTSNLAQKTDIARYEIIHRYGGVYLDCDFECLKNIENLISGLKAFSASESPGIISIGIMGCVPSHPIFKLLIDGLADSFYNNAYVNHQTGPYYITRMLGNRKDFAVFGPALFYPYLWNEKHRKGEQFS
ncbi:MAG: glycosyltransferase [Bacillota bacterium]|nr:glycosyltransferase [Bacillota bacterium]